MQTKLLPRLRCAALSVTVFSGLSVSAPAGDWQTSVSRSAPAVAARDAAWTATVVAVSTGMMTTGSLAGPDKFYRPDAGRTETGPRLTGRLHELDGLASYYWQGQMTATGERFDKRAMTAAHKSLPFGTRVRVTRLDNGGSVVVRINDRGPFKPGRVIDLSERAAEEIGMTGKGIMPVRLEVLGK